MASKQISRNRTEQLLVDLLPGRTGTVSYPPRIQKQNDAQLGYEDAVVYAALSIVRVHNRAFAGSASGRFRAVCALSRLQAPTLLSVACFGLRLKFSQVQRQAVNTREARGT